jgi:hypothetical protein
MTPSTRHLFARILAVTSLGGAASIGHAESPPARSDEAAFLQANDRIMATMHKGMSIQPTGDVDADFAAMMIPHHQGAIDMAIQELRYGKNEQLRRIAQEIIVEQRQEIDAMNLALGRPPGAPEAAPTQGPLAADSHPHHDTAKGSSK